MRIIKGAFIALVAVLSTTPSWAQAGWFLNFTKYYSDASKTTLIGSERLTCNYELIVKGSQSAYYDVIYGFCP